MQSLGKIGQHLYYTLYFEADVPDFGGKVGMVLVGGDVLSAFQDGDRSVVVVKPLTQP